MSSSTSMSYREAVVTETSTWLIHPALIIGAYPDPQGDKIETLMSKGVDTFITLQTESEFNSFRDYRPKVLAIAAATDAASGGATTHGVTSDDSSLRREIRFLAYPIVDRKVVDDSQMLAWASEIASLLNAGRVVYLHCHGGIGRTGVMAVLLLHHFIKLSYADSLRVVNELYRSRPQPGRQSRFSIPQTNPQRLQLDRLCR